MDFFLGFAACASLTLLGICGLLVWARVRGDAAVTRDNKLRAAA